MQKWIVALSLWIGCHIALLGLLVFGGRVFAEQMWRVVRRVVLIVVALYPLALLGLMFVQMIWPQDEGVWAVAQIFAPYLFAPLFLALPFALFRHARMLRVLLMLCALIFIGRFVGLPSFRQPQVPAGAIEISALNWNLGLGTEQAQISRARDILLAKPADIVVLEEAYWRWIENDPALTVLYPHRRALYYNGETGLVVLSTYPILHDDVPQPQNGAAAQKHPRQIVARLDVGGTPFNVVATHPPSPQISFADRCRLVCYATADRDQHLAQLHQVVQPLLDSGEPLLVLGDFNTTIREPIYRELSAGLREAHATVGSGAGLTWPLPNDSVAFPAWLQLLFPLIRIDHQFSNARLTPLATSVDCTLRGGDHCAVWGMYQIK